MKRSLMMMVTIGLIGMIPMATQAANYDFQTDKVNGSINKFDVNEFNVGKDETANWGFNAYNQTAITKVTGGSMSEIYGTLKSSGVGAESGKVILINPNGLMFGEGSQVNLNSFTASTLDVKSASEDGKTIEFHANGAKGDIKIEGSTWTLNQSGAIISSGNIEYKDSKITTTNANAGNIQLYTADGVTFTYVENGYINDQNVSVKANKNGKISLKNSEATKWGKPENITNYSIETGTLNAKAGNIELKNVAIKGTKLLGGNESGNIMIASEGTLTIDGSVVATADTIKDSENTFDLGNGHITLTAKKDIELNNSRLETAGKAGAKGVSSINMTANNNINVKDSNLKVSDNIKMTAINGINIEGNNNIGAPNQIILQTKGDITANANIYKSALFANGENITLKLQNANGKGIKVNAQNHADIDATDGELSIAKIVANTLTLDANDTFIADGANANIKETQQGELTNDQVAGKAYIEVNTQGGFSLDTAKSLNQTGKVQYQGNYELDNNGIYNAHIVKLNNSEGQFVLRYQKGKAIETVYDDSRNKLPLQAANVAKNGQITNNMSDPTSGMLAAAAQIEINEEDQMQY